MRASPAIRVSHLSKRYLLGSDYRTDSIREAIVEMAKGPFRSLRRRATAAGRPGPKYHDALVDVSFEVEPGEAVGVIGRNGAGKSTLLKILSRITAPGSGRIELFGRVGSLLEVGTGFHPELSGRDNIALNGAILGMSRREIARQFDQIVAFAEIGEFLDTPVKRYSSGMYVRLAFAVAAHLNPEILMVDEVLAVGDQSFQKKCLGKMNDLSSGGRTILFVSHNMAAIRSLTQRTIYMAGGRLAGFDATPAVIDQYLADAWEGARGEGLPDLADYRRDRHAKSPVHFRRIESRAASGVAGRVAMGEDFEVAFVLEAETTIPHCFVSFWLTNALGERVCTFSTLDRGLDVALEAGARALTCVVRGLPLTPGRYTMTAWTNVSPTARSPEVIVDYPAFEVIHPGLESGEVDRAGRPWGSMHWDRVEWSPVVEFEGALHP